MTIRLGDYVVAYPELYALMPYLFFFCGQVSSLKFLDRIKTRSLSPEQ